MAGKGKLAPIDIDLTVTSIEQRSEGMADERLRVVADSPYGIWMLSLSLSSRQHLRVGDVITAAISFR